MVLLLSKLRGTKISLALNGFLGSILYPNIDNKFTLVGDKLTTICFNYPYIIQYVLLLR